MSEKGEALTEPLDDIATRLIQNAAIGADIDDARDKAAYILLFSTAKEKALDAWKGLITVDPHEWKKIQALQNDVKRYEELAAWIRGAVIEGEEAFAQLQSHRGEDVPAGDGDDPED